MLDNAVRAPSAGFTQGWSFLVLDQPADVNRFWASTTPTGTGPPSRWLSGMRTAPVVVVPLSDKSAYLDRYAEPDKGRTGREEYRWSVPYWHVDTGMAALLVLQTAVDEGLGACFFGIPAERLEGLGACFFGIPAERLDALRREFAVPARLTPIGAITVGHRADDDVPSGSPSRRARRPTEEVVRRGGW
jgi:nitroreductase